MNKVTSFDVYKQYIALKLHFTSEKYDYFRMKGAVRANLSTFQNRNDVYKFQKLAKIHTKETLEKILVANLLKNKDMWIGDLLTPEARENLSERQKIEESLSYTFEQDTRFIFDRKKEGESIFAMKGRPGLVKYAMQGAITIESYIILCDLLNLTGKINKQMSGDPVWSDFGLKARKFAPFLTYDRKRYTEILRVVYQSVFHVKES